MNVCGVIALDRPELSWLIDMQSRYIFPLADQSIFQVNA